MRPLPELIAAGRPKSDPPIAATHDARIASFPDVATALPFGWTPLDAAGKAGAVARAYAWKRFTGAVRMACGTAKTTHRGAPGRAIPAILAASLQALGPLTATGEIEAALRVLPYSDVLTLLVSRLFARNPKGVELHDESSCLKCRKPEGSGVMLRPEHVNVGMIDWAAGSEPRVVVWLDDSYTLAGTTFSAVVVGGISWDALFGDCSREQFADPDRTNVRAGAASICAVVDAKGAVVDMPIPTETAVELFGENEFNRLAQAAYDCSSGVSIVAAVPCRKAGCGGSIPVPFDILTLGFG